MNSAWIAFQPYLPVLAGAAAAEAGKQLPAAVSRMWTSIRNRMSTKPAANEALEELLQDPKNADLQAVFRVQLKKIIQEDKGFQRELAQALQEAETESAQHISLMGDGAIAVGPGAKAVGAGGVIIEGNNNAVNSPGKKTIQRKKKA